jgi:predicted nuclease of restriction endonuclease-like (RecB) superfamily
MTQKDVYKGYSRVQQAVGFLEAPPDYCLNVPWGHNVIILNKVKDLIEREWYALRAIAHVCAVFSLKRFVKVLS